jgi:hypothetical protein
VGGGRCLLKDSFVGRGLVGSRTNPIRSRHIIKMDERSNLTFLLDVCQLMKRLTQLLKKQKYGDAENGEPKAKIMMLLQIGQIS